MRRTSDAKPARRLSSHLQIARAQQAGNLHIAQSRSPPIRRRIVLRNAVREHAVARVLDRDTHPGIVARIQITELHLGAIHHVDPVRTLIWFRPHSRCRTRTKTLERLQFNQLLLRTSRTF